MLIAAVVMLVVMLAGVQSAASIEVALDNQYYQGLADEAAGSGLVLAKACLDKTAGVPQWTNANPLKPGSDCAGTLPSSCTTTTPASGCYVLNDSNTKSAFAVTFTNNADGTVKTLTSSATLQRSRTSNGTIWRSYTSSTRADVTKTTLRGPQANPAVATGTSSSGAPYVCVVAGPGSTSGGTGSEVDISGATYCKSVTTFTTSWAPLTGASGTSFINIKNVGTSSQSSTTINLLVY